MKIQFEEFLTGINSVMIVDENYIILHALKINTRESKILKNPDRNHHKYVNRSIFDIFPSISVAESSYTEARRSMRPVVRFNQNYTDCFGMVCRTNNITIPLLRQGKVSGFVGLTEDITTVDAIINTDKDTLQRTRTISPPSTGNSFEDIVTQDSTMEKMITLSKKLATRTFRYWCMEKQEQVRNYLYKRLSVI